jgi:hypothetical protein
MTNGCIAAPPAARRRLARLSGDLVHGQFDVSAMHPGPGRTGARQCLSGGALAGLPSPRTFARRMPRHGVRGLSSPEMTARPRLRRLVNAPRTPVCSCRGVRGMGQTVKLAAPNVSGFETVTRRGGDPRRRSGARPGICGRGNHPLAMARVGVGPHLLTSTRGGHPVDCQIIRYARRARGLGTASGERVKL